MVGNDQCNSALYLRSVGLIVYLSVLLRCSHTLSKATPGRSVLCRLSPVAIRDLLHVHTKSWCSVCGRLFSAGAYYFHIQMDAVDFFQVDTIHCS